MCTAMVPLQSIQGSHFSMNRGHRFTTPCIETAYKHKNQSGAQFSAGIYYYVISNQNYSQVDL